MIVCLCRGVSDGEVRSAIRHGASTLDEVTRSCGAGGDCGACCDMVECMLEEVACAGAAQHEGAPSLVAIGKSA
jgi:bacterioferritin-associated ferredoxin